MKRLWCWWKGHRWNRWITHPIMAPRQARFCWRCGKLEERS